MRDVKRARGLTYQVSSVFIRAERGTDFLGADSWLGGSEQGSSPEQRTNRIGTGDGADLHLGQAPATKGSQLSETLNPVRSGAMPSATISKTLLHTASASTLNSR